MDLLNIKSLKVHIQGSEILSGVDLTVKAGEIHVVMGPNGTGKSTLANIICGHPDYELTSGTIAYEGENICELSPDQRALKGIFMSFQSPVEIPGVNNSYFLRAALNEKLKSQGQPPIDAADFLDLIKLRISQLGSTNDLVYRQLNVGFSGGEKKMNEILQMSVLEPKLSILDEIDSGLDIDALKLVAAGLQKLHTNKNAVIIITHYARILQYLDVDYVHIMLDGKIVKSGDKSLAYEIEENGYSNMTV